MSKRGFIHHIEINVSNLANSIQFWDWFLTYMGYEPFQSWEKGHSWKLGETYLVFVQTEEKYMSIPYHRCGTGLNHMAFHVDSKEQVDQLKDLLMRKNIDILYKENYPYAGGPNHYAVYFEDPDRIKVEVAAPFE
ncbi:VOC family protein [Metabacillus arenae]|uniref:VOC family protein n=1 Tax=Metabacillus arenae TaxID=2771434 RepID=A0A926NIY5_9BACI|nr:VOC family protein [Metabacillus arenae]MBD1380858.1 VOC family protein [Metabacillus arenae]